jgi:hypothetical protein
LAKCPSQRTETIIKKLLPGQLDWEHSPDHYFDAKKERKLWKNHYKKVGSKMAKIPSNLEKKIPEFK